MPMGDAFGSYLGMPGFDMGFGSQMPWTGSYPSGPAYGPTPYNPAAGGSLAETAMAWNGRNFKPGQTKRCADFVSTMIEQSGNAPPGFRHEVSAARLAQYGSPVGRDQLQPGDVVFFGNTYRQGRYTHVGIYIGNGQFVHRPTANAPVRVDRLDQGYYARKYTDARRLPNAGGNGNGNGNYGAAQGPNPNVGIPSYGPRPNRGQVNNQLEAAAAKYGIPPNILKAVAWQESGWRANASSFDGGHGKGIMQIDDRFHQFARTNQVWDPAQNIDYGARYLRELYDRTGSWASALRRYNGGSDYPPRIFAHAQNQPWARQA